MCGFLGRGRMSKMRALSILADWRRGQQFDAAITARASTMIECYPSRDQRGTYGAEKRPRPAFHPAAGRIKHAAEGSYARTSIDHTRNRNDRRHTGCLWRRPGPAAGGETGARYAKRRWMRAADGRRTIDHPHRAGNPEQAPGRRAGIDLSSSLSSAWHPVPLRLRASWPRRPQCVPALVLSSQFCCEAYVRRRKLPTTLLRLTTTNN